MPDGPTALRLLYRGTLLRLDRTALDRIRTRALPRGARRNEVRRAGIDGLFDALWAQALEQKMPGARSRPSSRATLAEREDFRSFVKEWWPRLRPRHVLRLAGRPGAAAPVRGRAARHRPRWSC